MIARAALGCAALACAALGAGACGGGDDDQPGGPDAGPLEYKACAEAARVGTFEVDLAAQFTGVTGRVYDSVDPTFVLETLATEGACRLAKAPIHFCDPACSPSDTCGPGGQCVPRPLAKSVGTVALTGLAVGVEMNPTTPGNFYTNPASLPHPGFEVGAAIALDAAGGDYTPFTLRGQGVSALAVDYDEVVVMAGAPVALTWTPPPAAGPMRMRIALSVNNHGLTGSRIECETEDTGAFTIPESLVTMLANAGLSGFPTLTLTRTTADSVTIAPGCVELRVQSELVIPVSIPGLESCSDNTDCTPPETCMSDLTCG